MSEVTEDQKKFCHGMNILLLIEHGLDGPMAARVAERFREKCAELASARKTLAAMTELYCELANSGDAGFWDPEKVPEVIAARSVLSPPLAHGEASEVVLTSPLTTQTRR